MKKYIVLILAIGFLSVDLLLAQETGAEMICLWEKVEMRNQVGKKSGKRVAWIQFGEKVTRTDTREIPVKEDGRVRRYRRVRNQAGQEGWVYAYYFAEGGALGIMLQADPVFPRPSKAAKPMKGRFSSGQRIILTETDRDWYRLTEMRIGNQTKLTGWVQGRNAFTTSENDLAQLNLLDEILAEADPQKQSQQMNELVQGMSDQSLGMQSILRDKILASRSPQLADRLDRIGSSNTNLSASLNSLSSPIKLRSLRDNPSSGIPSLANGNSTGGTRGEVGGPINPTYSSSKTVPVLDTEANAYFMLTIEEGYMEAAGTNAQALIPGVSQGLDCQVLHKSLPVGTVVLLSQAGQEKPLALKVTGTLRANSGSIIAISRSCWSSLGMELSMRSAVTLTYKAQ